MRRQLIDKDPSRAISLFWAAINSGDRVDSALKDMAVVMKQLNRSDEAIEAIKSFRHLCPLESHESLDNVLVELYKRSGRIDEQIEMLQLKLKHIEEGIAFGGKRTKTARSQGKKIQITIEQEYARLLGNLAWAYLQQNNFKSADELYRKALSLEPDKNKQSNLAICLMHMNKVAEAKFLLQSIRASYENGEMDDSYAKSFERAVQMLDEVESQSASQPISCKEEESCNPFPSLINGHSKELSIPTNGNENFVSGSGILVERNRGSCFRNCRENKNKFSGSDRGNSKCAPFGSKRTDNWFSRSGMEVGSSFTKAFASPIPEVGILEVPFTQPRRCSWLFNSGDGRSLVGEDANGGCNRKLSFEKGIDAENVQSIANQNLDGQSPCSSGDRRKKSWGDHTESVLQPIGYGEWKRNSREKDGQMNLPLARDSSSDADCDQNSNSMVADGRKMTVTVEQIAENLMSTQELQSPSQPVAENLKHPQDSSTCRTKKSWADMVEEDEQDLLSGRAGFPKNKWIYPSQESFSFQTPSTRSDGWNIEDKFNDENLDSNIIHETPTLSQIENLSQKFELFDLKQEYYTQPENAASSMNRTARRSLCFDRQENPDGETSYCSLPLPKKALNFEGYNSLLANERHGTSGNGIKLTRRNRLQVFQDITLLPESPRP